MNFARYNLSDQILDNLKTMGFKKPTDIQYKCIPYIQKGEDVMAIAQTGTGKTAAFAIPIIDKIEWIKTKNKTQKIRALIMVPTRELANQIASVFNKVGKGTKVKTLGLYGGVDQDPQIARLVQGVDILVATPGRMFDLGHQGYIDFEHVEILVLDEADHMLNHGFDQDVRDVVRKLSNRRQTLFFSATFDKRIKKLAYAVVQNAIRIQISPKDPISKNVEHFVLFVEMDDKRFFLQRIIEDSPDQKYLIFVRTKVRAERVCAAMARLKISSETLHGDKDQAERETVLENFKKGENLILITTDLSARGIDIPNVDCVINYDLPDKAENYVHRIGRTGRGRNRGQAFSFCSEGEKELLKLIEDFITVPISRVELSKKDYSQILELASENDSDWRSLMAEEVRPPSKVKKGKKKKG